MIAYARAVHYVTCDPGVTRDPGRSAKVCSGSRIIEKFFTGSHEQALQPAWTHYHVDMFNCFRNESMHHDYSRAIPETWQQIAKVFNALGDEHRQRHC